MQTVPADDGGRMISDERGSAEERAKQNADLECTN